MEYIFESLSSRHASDLAQIFHLQLPVALRRVNSDTASIGVVVSSSEKASSGLKEEL